MTSVTVKRGAGTRPGQAVTEALLSGSEAAARARANAELDAAGSQRERAALEIAPLAGLAPGMLVEVREIGREPWRGLVDGIRMEISAAPDGGRMTLARSFSVEIEREEENT